MLGYNHPSRWWILKQQTCLCTNNMLIKILIDYSRHDFQHTSFFAASSIDTNKAWCFFFDISLSRRRPFNDASTILCTFYWTFTTNNYLNMAMKSVLKVFCFGLWAEGIWYIVVTIKFRINWSHTMTLIWFSSFFRSSNL